MKSPQLPAPRLAAALGLTSEVWLKREDLHKSGSHKGRSIPHMIKEYTRAGKRRFVISSSGNAARSAMQDVASHNKNPQAEPLELVVLVGEHIDTGKWDILKKCAETTSGITLIQHTNPRQEAQRLSQKGYQLLRQSTDDTALFGYGELALELHRIPGLSAVFIPTSSGTLAEGIYQGFIQENTSPLPEFHIVQTVSCHPLATAWFANKKQKLSELPAEISLASAITDNIGQRQKQIINLLTATRGAAWIITNEQIQKAQHLVLESEGVEISATSALSVAALQAALASGWKPQGAVACLITGP